MDGGGGIGGVHFVGRVLTGRWFLVFSTLLVMSMAGATYMFGSYSGVIKSSLGYDQSTLNLLSFFKDLGSTVGIPAGLLMEIAPPWIVLTVGAVLNFFGYFMIWLGVSGHISKPTVWQMCLYICIGTFLIIYAHMLFFFVYFTCSFKFAIKSDIFSHNMSVSVGNSKYIVIVLYIILWAYT